MVILSFLIQPLAGIGRTRQRRTSGHTKRCQALNHVSPPDFEAESSFRPEMGSWSYHIGTEQNRNFRLEGDRLIPSKKDTPPNGERCRYQITWERIRH
jgi:hypothetical protein